MQAPTQEFSRQPHGPATLDETWRDECDDIKSYDWVCEYGRAAHERECFAGDRSISKLRSTPAREPWETLPGELNRIRNAVVQSREMLDLRDDWDDDGAKQISEEAWRRAAAFLTRYAERVWDRTSRVLDAPDLTPSVDGGVDLDWDKPAYRLLIAIPPDVGVMASFYGDNRGRGFIKGEFDVDDLNEGLIEWLTKA
ncbi:MAG: hypothetical protein HOP29_04980 [Phycisphaerales bacterium]|nr:hypothetical protein [Phycisphaerales bacterium]